MKHGGFTYNMSLFFSPNQDINVTQGKLPHWSQRGKLHFVTFRLADSLPKKRLEEIRQERQEWQENHRQPYSEKEWQDYYYLFSQRVENWLDTGSGGCLLSQPQYSQIVAGAIKHFERQRYLLDHWIIMPNHVHILLMPIEPYTLEVILHSWKSFTANRFLKRHLHTGQFWQHESFDHIVRSEKQLEHFRQYILENHSQTGCVSPISTQRIQIETK